MNAINFQMATDIEMGVPEMSSLDSEALTAWETTLMRFGEKLAPTIMDEGQAHPDGMFLEFAVAPAHSAADMLLKVETMRHRLEAITGYTLHGYDFVRMPEALTEDSHPFLYEMATTMGCSPDMTAGEYRSIPHWIRFNPYKEAGMHFHLDLPQRVLDTFSEEVDWRTGVTQMTESDRYAEGFVHELSRATRLFHVGPQGEYTPWYRTPGTYRLKPYGIEYRSIGSAVLNDPERLAMLCDTVYRFTRDYWRTHA